MDFNSLLDLWEILIPAQQPNSTVEFFILALDNANNLGISETTSYITLDIFDGDINGDGKIRVDDILIVALNFGKD